MIARSNPITKLLSLLVAALIASAGGCGLGFTISDQDNGNDNGVNQPPPPQGVTVRLANLTDAAVETSLYVSTNSLADPVAELFVPANLFTDRVGVAATGLIPPLDVDTIELDCGDELVVGTSEARFLDQETGDPLGTGNRRIVELDLVFDCGDQITFIYDREGNEYFVDLAIE